MQSLASWLNQRMKLPLNASKRQGKNQKVHKHHDSLVLFISMTSFALVLIEVNRIYDLISHFECAVNLSNSIARISHKASWYAS